MDKLIEIQRRIDRKMGNKVIFDKLRAGEYRLRTGEANLYEEKSSSYAEQLDKELGGIVDRIGEDEGMEFGENEANRHVELLQRQMDEGRKTLVMRVRGEKKKMTGHKEEETEIEEEPDSSEEGEKKIFF